MNAEAATSPRLRIVVDRELCEGNARCVQVAPDIFQTDERDQLHLAVERPTEAQREAVETAVALCPRGALALTED